MPSLRKLLLLGLLGSGQAAVPVTPATVFDSRLLVWQDPSDLSVAWQDSGRTTPAVAGQPVGSRQNKGVLSHYMQQAVAGSRPTLTLSGGLYSDAGDGLDDCLVSSAALDLTPYSAVTIIAGVRKTVDATSVVVEHGPTASATNGTFSMIAANTGLATFGAQIRGTATASGNTPANFPSPTTRVLTAVLDLTQVTRDAAVLVRVDGVAQANASGTNANPAGTVYSSQTLNYLRRNAASLPLAGNIYQLLIVAGLLSASEIAFAEQWCATKSGVTL